MMRRNELPHFARTTYRLNTAPDEDPNDEGMSSDFDSEQGLKLFAEWMKFVQDTAYKHTIKEGVSLWNHRSLYRMYVQSPQLAKFFEDLAGYEGKLLTNHRLDGKRSHSVFEMDEKEVERL